MARGTFFANFHKYLREDAAPGDPLPGVSMFKIQLHDEQIILLWVETFEGLGLEFYTVGMNLKSEELFHQFLAEQGIGYKTIASFEIETLDGDLIRYYRNYRGQEYRLDNSKPYGLDFVKGGLTLQIPEKIDGY